MVSLSLFCVVGSDPASIDCIEGADLSAVDASSTTVCDLSSVLTSVALDEDSSVHS